MKTARLLLTTIAAFAVTGPLISVETDAVEVQKVLSGDRIVVTASLGGQPIDTTVRLLWVSTPSPDSEPLKEAGQQAKIVLEGLLWATKELRLWSPEPTFQRDNEGHILAVLMDNEANLNAWMIQMGHSAYWQKRGAAPDHKTDKILLYMQETAKKQGLGLWSTSPEWIEGKSQERPIPPAISSPD